MRRFGGDPNAIGRTIRINSQPLTVVGVTPKAFNGLDSVGQTDIWVPLAAPGIGPVSKRAADIWKVETQCNLGAGADLT